MSSKIRPSETPSPHPSQGDREWGLWSAHQILFLPLFQWGGPPTGDSFL